MLREVLVIIIIECLMVSTKKWTNLDSQFLAVLLHNHNRKEARHNVIQYQ